MRRKVREFRENDAATGRMTGRRMMESSDGYFGKIAVGLDPNVDITGAAGLNEF